MPVPITEAQRIEALETRVDILLTALRGAFSGIGKPFGDATFYERWQAAEPVVEEEP
jgi:hypothetical protein